MTTRQPITDFEQFVNSSEENRRLLRQEELILEITESISAVMEAERITQAELARRLGKSKGRVSQLLAGDRNLTLRTISDVCDALGCRPGFQVKYEIPMQHNIRLGGALGFQWTELGTRRLVVHEPERVKGISSPSDELRIAA